MKKWIWIVIAASIAILSALGFALVKINSVTVKYGTPHYRPKV